MAFLGTQQKCKACQKTVYPVDELTADGIVYHKACFRCHHCGGTLKLGSYASLEGVLYCKPHFNQLFKRTGTYSRNFEPPSDGSHKAKFTNGEKTDEPHKPNPKLASMFSGTQDKCIACSKTVYPLEKISVDQFTYHKSCFKCVHGGCILSPSNYAALEGRLYCKHHYSQLFKETGNYSQLSKTPAVKPLAPSEAS